jgi:HIRAN domain
MALHHMLTSSSSMYRPAIATFNACRCADGEPVTIQHEPSNTRDRNALLVLGSRNQVCRNLAQGAAIIADNGCSACRVRPVLGSWVRVALQVLGHLAAEVAKWLGPLVIGNMVEAAGTVQDEPATLSSPITISIQVLGDACRLEATAQSLPVGTEHIEMHLPALHAHLDACFEA